MNKPDIRNVLLLTVDALKTSFLRAEGNPLNVCPTINFLGENGILSLNTRTHGFPTQMAFPSILTGTLPLDHGGYDAGISGRPLSLAEVLKDAGLRTTAFSSSPWLSRLFAYDRGFDEFHELFDIDKFWKLFSITYGKYYAGLLTKEIIGPDEYLDMAGKWFVIFIKDLQRLCLDKQHEIERRKFPYRREIHRHNFKAVGKSLEKILSQHGKNPENLLTLHKSCRLDGELTMLLEGKPPLSPLKKWLVKSTDHLLKLFLVQMWRRKYSPPAPYYADRILSVLRKDGHKPFFMWTHFLDIHDNTYTKGPIGLPPNPIPLVPARLLTRNNPASMVRTLSLRYVDNQIARIIKALRSADLLDTTLIIVCGDHGYPVTSYEKIPGNMFDESVRVPLIFYNPHLGHRKVHEPCGLFDIAPTVLDLMGVGHRPEFTGESIARSLPADRPVILENLGPGPADFRYKALKIAVIKGKFKLIWREQGYEKTSPPGENYLFNLDEDPGEKLNLYSDREHREIVSDLESIVRGRCAELRRQNS